MKEEDFMFTYESADDFQAFPTIFVKWGLGTTVPDLHGCPGMPNFNLARLLHGEE